MSESGPKSGPEVVFRNFPSSSLSSLLRKAAILALLRNSVFLRSPTQAKESPHICARMTTFSHFSSLLLSSATRNNCLLRRFLTAGWDSWLFAGGVAKDGKVTESLFCAKRRR